MQEKKPINRACECLVNNFVNKKNPNFNCVNSGREKKTMALNPEMAKNCPNQNQCCGLVTADGKCKFPLCDTNCVPNCDQIANSITGSHANASKLTQVQQQQLANQFMN